jgi:regulator of replication initiation timing
MSKELENLRQDKNDLLKENEQLKQENIKLDNIINDFMKADAARFEAKKDNFLSNIFSNKKNTPPNPLIIRK